MQSLREGALLPVNSSSRDDARWLAAAASIATRARPISAPNPAVGAVIVKDGVMVGRGWTQAGGRPHAEAIALDQAGSTAKGATLYVTLEPCAHQSDRVPACAELVSSSGIARAVIGCEDPDPRTAGNGTAAMHAAGIETQLLETPEVLASLSGYLTQRRLGRPEVTLKLAMSLDGCIAMASGESQWITGDTARDHSHMMRAKSDAILVGAGTLRADNPRLDVRLPGLAARSPKRWVLTGGQAPEGWQALSSPDSVFSMANVQYLFVEGGAQTAAAFLQAGLVDKLMIYRAPILIGSGIAAIADFGLAGLNDAHGQWQFEQRRQLGCDTLEIYTHVP